MKTRYLVVFCQIVIFLFFSGSYSQWEQSTHKNEIQSVGQIQHGEHSFIYNSSSLDSTIAATMSEYHVPGLSACVLKDGELVWKSAYGYADIEHNIPVTDSTLFMLASISKTITGTALMQLYERGLFNLDDNVNKYLPPDLQVVNPFYPNDPITFKMILSHVSSINDNWSILLPLCGAGDSPITLFDFLKNYLMPDGAYFSTENYNSWPPATNYDYCNVATVLVGYLVEEIAGTSFDDYCHKHIFAPLGMTETSWFLSDIDTSHLARPYLWIGSDYIPYIHYGYPHYPAGQLRTSSLQLARFLNAFMQKGTSENVKILESSTVDLMTTIPYPTIATEQGLIWFMRNYGGHPAWGHVGVDDGVMTIMGYDESDKTGVIVLTNGESYDGPSQIVSLLFDYTWPSKKNFASNASVSSAFVRGGIDPLLILSQFTDTENHQFELHAIITSADKTYTDSLALYDDGQHGDFQAGDGSWGNFYVLPPSTEKEFLIGISTVDLTVGSYYAVDGLARFTSIGPIVFQDFEFVNPDTLPNPGENFAFRLLLRNNGKATNATNITAKLSCLDTVATVSSIIRSFGAMAPGETLPSDSLYKLTVAQNCPGDIEIPIRVDILSGGHIFWNDTFFVHIYPSGVASRNEKEIPETFSLRQNYPNPFNPTTTISYALAKDNHIRLTVYNSLGQVVAVLVDGYQIKGSYRVKWDGHNQPSGIYLYQLKADGFSAAKKMFLQK